MSDPSLAPAPARWLRRPRFSRAGVVSLARRFAQFWIVWSFLLLFHEGGHAVSAWRQGIEVSRVTVGMGPELWRGTHGDTELVLRAVPVAGITQLATEQAAVPEGHVHGRPATERWTQWARQLRTLFGGVLATLGVAVIVAGLVVARERTSGQRWVWGRILVADAIVLTVFNFLPVPPLDGGRAVLGAVAALRGEPLAGDALFWVQLGGLALAVVPMTLWPRWTARIDAAALWWGAPGRRPWTAGTIAAPANAA